MLKNCWASEIITLYLIVYTQYNSALTYGTCLERNYFCNSKGLILNTTINIKNEKCSSIITDTEKPVKSLETLEEKRLIRP